MEQPFSSYRFGASRGLYLGLFCTALILVMANADSIPLGGLLGLILMLLYPAMIFLLFHNASRQIRSPRPLSSMWLAALLAIFCSTLIAGTLSIIYFRWINPDYIFDRISQAATLFADSPVESLHQFSITAQTLIQNHQIPTPVEFSVSIMWALLLIGVITSSIISVGYSIYFAFARPKYQ